MKSHSFFALMVLIALFSTRNGSADLTAQIESMGALNWSSHTVQTRPFGDSNRYPVVAGCALQTTGNLVAIVGDNHVVNIYDRVAGRFTHQLGGHTDWVQAARFSPDGRWLATCGNDRRILLWDTRSFSEPQTLFQGSDAIADINFTNDGTKLVAVGFENKVYLFDLNTRRQIMQLPGPCEDLRCASFSDDDSLLAVGGRNGIVRIFNAISGDQITDIELHKRRIRSIQFTMDNRLITCGEDSVVKLTDISNATAPMKLPQHGGKLFAVRSLGGNLLATGGSNNKIYIWDVEQLKQVGTLEGHTGTVSSLDYHAGLLVSGSFDTQVRFWSAEKIASLIEERESQFKLR